MTIRAEIICDSMSPTGTRLTTFKLQYPRFILAEVNTHRMLSKNSSSARAIPLKRQVKMILDDTAMPLQFLANKKGMQGGAVIEDQDAARDIWFKARDRAIDCAKEMEALNVHKQFAGRLLAPFSHSYTVISGTDWSNFFALRIHSAAQPEIYELAKQMWELYQQGDPPILCMNDWHLPFVTEEEMRIRPQEELIIHSVARCARVSYVNFDGNATTYEEDKALFDKLLSNNPKHMSSAEHQATPSGDNQYYGNFCGWKQYRKFIANENITTFSGQIG